MDDKKKQGQELLNHILIEYSPLISLHAKKLKNEGLIPEGIDTNDLHVEGFKGLVDALHRYDSKVGVNPKAKNPFAAYAKSRIRGKMLDHISSQDAVPKHIRAKAKTFAASQAALKAVPTPTAPTIKPPSDPQ